MSDIRPTAPGARIVALDTLRGIALAGILLINILGMAGPVAMDRPIGPPLLDDGDWQVWLLAQMFVHGAMRGLFSMLFGVGLLIFLDHGDEAERTRLYARRLGLLFLFGVIDATLLLWPGDILTTYALTGVLVFAMRGLPRSHMIVAALVILVFVALWQAGDAALMPPGGDVYTTAMWDREETARLGGYGDTLAYMAAVSWAWTVNAGSLRWVGDAAGPMLIGIVLYRSGAFDRGSALPGRLALFGYGIGLPVRIAHVMLVWRAGGEASALSDLLDQPGRLTMTLGHLGLFLLLWRGAEFRAWSRPWARFGRMALTFYLMQNLIGGWVFSGFGLGLWGSVGGWSAWGIAALIVGGQMLLAAIWLRWFAYGPVEWLWRWGTYGVRPHIVAPIRGPGRR
jgi:uncharacterized protein